MKVLYHHRTQAGDAQGIHIQEMVSAFQDVGCQVKIAALVEKDVAGDKKVRGRGWEKVASLAPQWVYELLGLFYNLPGIMRLLKVIRSFKPDFIYERYSLNTFCGVWAAALYRIPIILEVNAPLYYEQKKLGKLVFRSIAKFSERWICSHASQTLVVSNVMKKMLVDEGVPETKILVVYNGVDPKRFYQQEKDAALYQKYGLADSVVIGFVGWFRKWHGVEMLLRAFHASGLFENGAKLMLVGDGPAFQDLSDYVRENDLQNDVIFTGPVASRDIPACVSLFDVAMQPAATPYACPMKVVEYMAMGKCIIAADQDNIRELLKNGDTAMLFEKDDRTALQRQLERVVPDYERRRRLGENAARAVAARRLLWSDNARRVIEIVEKARFQS